MELIIKFYYNSFLLIQVIIGCRNVERGQNAAEKLNNDERVKGNGEVIFKQLDLASFESIRNHY